MYAVGRGRDTRGAMRVFRVGGRAEEYIMADHLPPHNYGVRPWGVGFEMSPGQNDIMRADIWSASHLFTSGRRTGDERHHGCDVPHNHLGDVHVEEAWIRVAPS